MIGSGIVLLPATLAAVALLFCLLVIGYAEPKLLLPTAGMLVLTLPVYLPFFRFWSRGV